mmetsp:Transcript_11071/g.25163  ORF Transcript_11071/g.25163 Transcript_11071/m.25163 type:complete len:220 (+) Transcript_11071:185-844(+)
MSFAGSRPRTMSVSGALCVTVSGLATTSSTRQLTLGSCAEPSGTYPASRRLLLACLPPPGLTHSWPTCAAEVTSTACTRAPRLPITPRSASTRTSVCGAVACSRGPWALARMPTSSSRSLSTVGERLQPPHRCAPQKQAKTLGMILPLTSRTGLPRPPAAVCGWWSGRPGRPRMAVWPLALMQTSCSLLRPMGRPGRAPRSSTPTQLSTPVTIFALASL